MQLNFTTHINGKPNYFVEGILNGLLDKNIINIFDYNDFLRTYINYTPKVFNSCIKSYKIHTLRKDKNNRFKAGINLHLVINPYQKGKRLQFAPLIKCKSTQTINISFWYNKKTEQFDDPYILIDGEPINKKQMQQLAINDGFDTLQDFLTYFKGGFNGKIVHWTNFKY